MKNTWLLFTAILILALAACSPAAEASSGGSENVPAAQNPADTELQADFTDALSIQGQLAVGTLLLEETDLAVDETLAAELYPLWQAVQSLSDSDTAADVEIQAVVNQIQDTMHTEQVAAIAEMQLTAESLTTMLEEGTLALGGGGFGRGSGEDGEGGRPAGGFGGGPGGGVPGGGRPGGGPGGGALPEGIDPEAIATRQAEFAGGDTGSFQERAMLGAVVRLLGTRTGEVEEQPVRQFEVVFDVVAQAIGLSVEEIRSQTAEGTTLAEIVESNGGDLDAVYEALVTALGELPNADELDLEEMATQWLGLEE